MNATVGYIDLRQNDLRAVQDLVLRKVLGENYEGTDPAELSWRGEFVDFRGMQVASFWPMKLAKAQSQISYRVVKEVQRVRYGEEADFMPTTADVPCHDCGAIWGEYTSQPATWSGVRNAGAKQSVVSAFTTSSEAAPLTSGCSRRRAVAG